MGHEFRARNLSEADVGRIKRARQDMITALDLDPREATNERLLMLLVNDTAPSWRKGR